MSKNKSLHLVLVILGFLAVVSSFPADLYAADNSGPGILGKLPPGIAGQIERSGQADLLLVLDDSDAKALAVQMRESLHLGNDNAAIVSAKARLFKEKKNTVLSMMSKQDYALLKDYENFPILHLRANSNALERLLSMSEVASISEDISVRPSYTDNQVLIGIPAAWSYGTGAGTSVAVLDSGIDYSASGFITCATAGDPGCIAYEQCFATGGCLTDKSHGTNVSGVVFQVAPDAEIVSLDVFRTTGSASYSDILSAMNWMLTPQTPLPAPYVTYNIVAVNMSLGDNVKHTSPCPNDALASAIYTMKGAGIATAVASGNEAFTDGLTAPACGPDAISVGAVYAADYGTKTYSVCTDSTTAADQVTCFSDSAPFLSILAPGAVIAAGGYTMSGTSQAAPHVSGAVAVLKDQTPALTVDQTLARLAVTGSPVYDGRNGITKPRLDLSSAVSVSSPIIVVNPSSFSFMAAQGGLNPAGQTLNISNAGVGTMNWNFDTDPAQTWATGVPASGTDTGTVTVSVNTSGMTTPGTYNANPQVSSTGAMNTPVTLPVTLQLVDAAYTEDFESPNLTHKFPWATGGNGSWTAASGTGHTGTYAAQSPAMTHNQLSYIEVTLNVTSPGYVYFWLKTSTEPKWDKLVFRIDGTIEGLWSGWSGNTDWTFAQSQIQAAAGVHIFRWEYSKDASVSQGSDAVWIDDIFFPPSNTQVPLPSVSPASQDFGSIPSGGASAPVTFTIENTGTGNLVIGTVSITDTNASDFTKQNDTCSGQTVAPSGSCTVEVKFTPLSSGSKSAFLTVPSNYPLVSYTPLTGTALASYTLTVGKSGTGTGSVSSVPAGITCGVDCTEPYTQGTPVTLFASADPNSSFAGWSGGGCSGTGTCGVTMNGNISVTATFNLLPPVADFSGYPLSGPAPLDVTFTDSSTNSPTSWSWTFGDAGTSTLANPVHTYQNAGTYSVSLTASNAGGPNTMTKTGYITVSCPVLPVRIPRATPLYYSSLQSGYNAASGGEVVQVQSVTLTESPDLDNGTAVTLKGGYDQCYSSNTGTYSTIQGSLTISTGTVTIENVEIK